MASSIELFGNTRQPPKVMVIGGSGFIGSEVVKVLAASGCRITALQHRSRVRVNGVRSIEGDLRTFDWSRLEHDLPDVIIHSGRISGRTWPGRILAGMQGRRANARLMKWLSRLTNPPSLVYVSGSLVYGSQGGAGVSESAPLNPAGFQKYYIRAERPILESAADSRVPVSIARVPWVLGPASWFRQFYWRAVRKQHEIPCFGEGENLMSVVHLRDCAGLIARISGLAAVKAGQPATSQGPGDRAASPEIFNITTIPAVTQSDFCQTLSALTGVPVRYYTERQLRTRYGQTVTEALTFSLSLISERDTVSKWEPGFPTVGAALRDVVRNLED
ncbi:NAD(P)-dependent oxidoreductase [Balneolales bacterium ANBcel1]|nr:NAD(P)-dependent oxidoreductase [Balneolales bacterium ANBcel1]